MTKEALSQQRRIRNADFDLKTKLKRRLTSSLLPSPDDCSRQRVGDSGYGMETQWSGSLEMVLVLRHENLAAVSVATASGLTFDPMLLLSAESSRI